MKDPKPWKTAGADAPQEAWLLNDVHVRSRMPSDARARLAARLFEHSGATSLAPEWAVPAGPRSGTRVKVIAIAVVGLGLGAFASFRVSSVPSKAPLASFSASSQKSEAPVVPSRSVDELSSIAPLAPLPPVADERGTPAREHLIAKNVPRATEAADSLLRETELVDAARAKLATDPAQALEILDRHLRDHNGGQLALERDVLRLEAMVRLGHREDAERIGRSIENRAKGTPYAERAARVLARAPRGEGTTP